MFYFSEIENKEVIQNSDKFFGKVKDLVFVNDVVPSISKILVTRKKGDVLVPIESVAKTNSRIYISKPPENIVISDNELFIKGNLLDKQVIDLVGNKVVRVNDVAVHEKPHLYIAGIDISFLGILRRIGLADNFCRFFHRLKLDYHEKLLSWADIQNLEIQSGKIKLKQREEKLSKIHPEDLADYLEMTRIKNVVAFLGQMNPEMAAEVFHRLNVSYQTAVFERFDNQKAAEIINTKVLNQEINKLSKTVNKPKENHPWRQYKTRNRPLPVNCS